MTRQFHRPARLDPEAAESIEGTADTAASSELAHRTAQALLGGYPSEGGGAGGRQAPRAPPGHSPAGAPADAPGGWGAPPPRPRPRVGFPLGGGGRGRRGPPPPPPLGNCAAGEASEEPGEWLARPDVVAAVASHGVDAVAELWADSPATTLPGVLWRLFLVREWIRRDPALVARRYATVVDLTGRDDKVLARFEAALAEADPAPSPLDVRALLDRVLTGRADGGLPALVPVLATVAAFLRALAAGSDPAWIVDDADELADRVTRRDSALLATADEVTEAARRAASGRLD